METAFYYWKNTTNQIHQTEAALAKKLETKKLYVKLFEVEKDAKFGIQPIAKTQLGSWGIPSDLRHLHIIPTIFIKNEVLRNTPTKDLNKLAKDLIFLSEKYYAKLFSRSYPGFTEMQIDCDWTASTKENYFYLLYKIKTLSEKEISCTLRLYPYMYPKIMGVPPVDKVTLMCYNLTNSLEKKNNNSIQDNTELEKYLKGVKKYPVHLDIALPFYSWTLVFQNNKFEKVLSLEETTLKEIAHPTKPLWWEVHESKAVGDIYLRIGDQLKVERITKEETEKTIALLKKYIDFDDYTTLSFFHLDHQNTKLKNENLASHFITEFRK